MNDILLATLIVAGIGLFLGVGLGVASVLFHVKIDEKEQKLIDILPGANCGACSYAGCAEYAKALTSGQTATNLCTVGGEAVMSGICEILGVETVEIKRKVAFVHCQGSGEHTKKVMDYQGIKTCYAANLLCRSRGACVYSCEGYGDCAAACPYGAIDIINGVAKVNSSVCTGCGLCVAACPKGIISMVYAGDYAKLGCANKDKGALTRKVCAIGCIACTKCVKACPENAISMAENRAVVDLDKCTGCGKCVEICPTNSLVM